MILCDFNNVSSAAILATMYGPNALDSTEVNDEAFIRHLLLNSLLSYRQRYMDAGQIVVCCDSANSWRKDVYPYYKVRRHSKDKTDSPVDWDAIYSIRNKVLDEIQEYMPYPVVRAPRAEGDDCIAILAKRYAPSEKIVVVSNDKDFIQLKAYPNLIVYRPLSNEEVKCDDPVAFLKEMIIRGDDGDDVPNIFSDDDVFVVKEKRQKSVMKKKLEGYLNSPYSTFAETDKIERNLNMIDLSRIPNEISEKITNAYEAANDAKSFNRQKIFKYFVANNLRKLIESVENF